MRIGAGVAVAVWIVLAGAPNAAAATFAVTRTDDPAPDACDPSDCSLREAVLAANALPGSDALLLPAGHFRLSIPGPGENAGAAGDLDLTGRRRRIPPRGLCVGVAARQVRCGRCPLD